MSVFCWENFVDIAVVSRFNTAMLACVRVDNTVIDFVHLQECHTEAHQRLVYGIEADLDFRNVHREETVWNGAWLTVIGWYVVICVQDTAEPSSVRRSNVNLFS